MQTHPHFTFPNSLFTFAKKNLQAQFADIPVHWLVLILENVIWIVAVPSALQELEVLVWGGVTEWFHHKVWTGY